ncbi:hypothetical protein RND81_02G238600 [Saponaria officinalis]|uniref:Uncharacterized protein n=1 Tax=Saponaria officinalis TaxID=3572 RepID=A0AAW1MWX5_SAPOF
MKERRLKAKVLCYLDRFDFELREFERTFPILEGWTDERVKARLKSEEKAGGFGKGSVVPRQNIIILHQKGYISDKDFNRLQPIDNEQQLILPIRDATTEGPIQRIIDDRVQEPPSDEIMPPIISQDLTREKKKSYVLRKSC